KLIDFFGGQKDLRIGIIRVLFFCDIIFII
ncbi:unnamed protein product, partial [marine sediment metagenome]